MFRKYIGGTSSSNMMKKIYTALMLLSIGATTASNHSLRNSNSGISFRNIDQSKIDYENSICECVPYYQCNFNGTMNVNGEGIIDIRTGFVGTLDNPVS